MGRPLKPMPPKYKIEKAWNFSLFSRRPFSNWGYRENYHGVVSITVASLKHVGFASSKKVFLRKSREKRLESNWNEKNKTYIKAVYRRGLKLKLLREPNEDL